MLTKFITRVVVPIAILASLMLLAIYAYVDEKDPHLGLIISFAIIAIVALFSGISIALFIIGVFIPGFYDYKFWSGSSLDSLTKEDLKIWWPTFRYGKLLRFFYFLFVGVFVFGIIFLSIMGISIYKCYHFNKYGIETKALIRDYRTYSIKGSTKKYIDVDYRTVEGEVYTKEIWAEKIFRVGDSIKVIYSSKRPSIVDFADKPCKMW